MVIDRVEPASVATPASAWPTLLDAVTRDGGVRMHYQPIVDLTRGSVVGYEGLARFVPGTSTSPLPWFEAARAHGRVAELEAAALRAAFADRASLPANTFLTVNVGPDVLDHPEVRDALDGEGSLAGVVIELTEHARVDSYLDLEPALNRLRSAGALLAIDDAGAGYAGLQHLLSIRPDIIKLDRALVASVDRDEAKRALVEMLGTFASRVDAWVLAEGVETLAELETVARLGVPLGQGYYLALPGEPWPELDDSTAVHLRSFASRTDDSTLRSLMENARTAFNPSHAAEAFVQDDVDVVVILDEHGRPVATLDPEGLLHPVRDTSLQVNADTPVAQAAHRALTRPDGRRFHPMVCTDNAGRFVGLVRMERILDFLAASTAG